jgi:hypothetical protein
MVTRRQMDCLSPWRRREAGGDLDHPRRRRRAPTGDPDRARGAARLDAVTPAVRSWTLAALASAALLVVLVGPSSVDFAPARAADFERTGRSVLFYTSSTDRGGRFAGSHVYRVSPDGSGRRALTSGLVADQSLLAAPDGENVAFSRDCYAGNRARSRGTFVVDRAGRRVRRLAGRGSGPVAWSPDSRRLAYSMSDELFVVGVDGSSRRR